MTVTEKRHYKNAANYLRKLGVKVTLKGNRTPTPQQKSAVTKYFNKFGGYSKAIKNNKGQTTKLTLADNVKFIKLSRSSRKNFRNVVSNEQLPPKGVLLVVPRGADPKKYKYNVKGTGQNAYLETVISGQRSDKTVRLDPVALAVDPVEAAKKALSIVHPEAAKLRTTKMLEGLTEARKEIARKDKLGKLPNHIKIVVGGNEQHGGNDFAVFFRYFVDLYNGTSDGSKKSNRKNKPLSDEKFADLFHLKLVYTDQDQEENENE